MNMSFAQQTGAESPGKGRRQQPTIKGLSFLEPFGFALAGCSGGLVLIWLAELSGRGAAFTSEEDGKRVARYGPQPVKTVRPYLSATTGPERSPRWEHEHLLETMHSAAGGSQRPRA